MTPMTMPHLTANDLKTRGIAAIESMLSTQPEVTISVRGKERFVVMDMAHYHYLRECELEAALAQSQADMAAGRFKVESAAHHVARIAESPKKVSVVVRPKTSAKTARKTAKRSHGL
jgi:PHD/YefM family antitoxin component YafN of YafNO toxin-antitoxin module